MTEHIMSSVIQEDVIQLAEALQDFHAQFEGKTFLITGAGGFLGRYMVALLKYLNDRVLSEKASAVLLDNFITGYEQQIQEDEHLIFKKHNVSDPFLYSGSVDYIIHAAGIASPYYYTKF